MVVGVGWVKEMDAVASENDGVMFEAGCDWTHIAGVVGGSMSSKTFATTISHRFKAGLKAPK